jgi:hypothetical protein
MSTERNNRLVFIGLAGLIVLAVLAGVKAARRGA